MPEKGCAVTRHDAVHQRTGIGGCLLFQRFRGDRASGEERKRQDERKSQKTYSVKSFHKRLLFLSGVIEGVLNEGEIFVADAVIRGLTLDRIGHRDVVNALRNAQVEGVGLKEGVFAATVDPDDLLVFHACARQDHGFCYLHGVEKNGGYLRLEQFIIDVGIGGIARVFGVDHCHEAVAIHGIAVFNAVFDVLEVVFTAVDLAFVVHRKKDFLGADVVGITERARKQDGNVRLGHIDRVKLGNGQLRAFGEKIIGVSVIKDRAVLVVKGVSGFHIVKRHAGGEADQKKGREKDEREDSYGAFHSCFLLLFQIESGVDCFFDDVEC